MAWRTLPLKGNFPLSFNLAPNTVAAGPDFVLLFVPLRRFAWSYKLQLHISLIKKFSNRTKTIKSRPLRFRHKENYEPNKRPSFQTTRFQNLVIYNLCTHWCWQFFSRNVKDHFIRKENKASWNGELTDNRISPISWACAYTTESWLALKILPPAKMREIVRTLLSHLLTLLVAFVLLGLVEWDVFDGFRELANVVALDYVVVYTKHDELRSNYLQKERI